LLPQPLGERYPAVTEIEGVGNHWRWFLKTGVPTELAHPPEKLLFSSRMIGHGSLSGSIFLIDLDQDLVIVQLRRNCGPRYEQWCPKFLQAVAHAVTADGDVVTPR
jgi:hypothetical protein